MLMGFVFLSGDVFAFRWCSVLRSAVVSRGIFANLAKQAEIAETNCLTSVPPSQLRRHGERFVDAIKQIAATAERVGDEKTLDGLPGSVNARTVEEANDSWNARYARSDEALKKSAADMNRRVRSMHVEYEEKTRTVL